MRRYPSSIVGLPYPNKDGVPCHQVVAEILAVGDAVELERDVNNPHNANAVAVWAYGRHVGFVPARHDFIAEQLARGGDISASVTEIHRDDAGTVKAVFLAVDLPSSLRSSADFTQR